MIILEYLNLITSEHREKPKYIQMLSEVFGMYVDVANQLNSISESFDIDNAVGNQLDIIGELVGQSRELPFDYEQGNNILDDENYRILLKSKILQNSWDGTTEDLYKLWEQLFPDIYLALNDDTNMSCMIFVQGNYTPVQWQLLINGKLLPRPAGVSYSFKSLNAPLFAYDYDNETSDEYKGYDGGYWSVFGASSRIFALDYDNDLDNVYVGLDLGLWYQGA